jgi:hypothetical protein
MHAQRGRSRVRAIALVTLAALAGCAAPGGEPGEWYLGGSFTTERTQADIDAVCAAGAGDSECTLVESYPEQFGFRFSSQAKCDAARAKIAEVPHTSVRACVKVNATSDGDAPTSSGG